jgi:hypothetical protein
MIFYSTKKTALNPTSKSSETTIESKPLLAKCKARTKSQPIADLWFTQSIRESQKNKHKDKIKSTLTTKF